MSDRFEKLSKRNSGGSDNVYHLPVRDRRSNTSAKETGPTRYKAVVRRFPGRPETSLPVDGLKRVKPLGQSPSTQQKRWLKRGLAKEDGKLPLFEERGQSISERTVKTCVARGWVEPLFQASREPVWTVCRLTDLGRAVVS